MGQAKLTNEDIVQIVDNKIIALSDHLTIDVAAGDDYNTVLTKLMDYVLTPAQWQSLQGTLTAPSATNPVVVKDDLPTYYPIEDQGEFKDAVENYGDLPGPLTPDPPGPPSLNDLRPVLSENTIYRWDGFTWVIFLRTGTMDHTVLSNKNTEADYQHFTYDEKTALLNAVHSHLNKLILDGIQGSGSGLILSDPERLLIPTALEKEALRGSYGVLEITGYAQSGTGAQIVLDPLFSEASQTYFNGKKVWITEGAGVSQLKTVPVLGNNWNNLTKILTLTSAWTTPLDITSKYSISGDSTRYVTEQDFRLNTLTSPFITFGYPLSGANFEGTDILTLQAALDSLMPDITGTAQGGTGSQITLSASLDVSDPTFYNDQKIEIIGGTGEGQVGIVPFSGNNWDNLTKILTLVADWETPLDNTSVYAIANVKSLAILPQDYPLNASVNQGLVWDKSSSGLRLDGFEIGNATLTFNTLKALWLKGSGTGACYIKGIDFVFGGFNVEGIVVDTRDRTIIENCIFHIITGKSVTLNADHCIIRNCTFYNSVGLLINGNNTIVENCIFSNSRLEISGNKTSVRGCVITVTGSLKINTGAEDALIFNNRITGAVTDAGVNTRWIEGIPQDYGQPFIGQIRTLGTQNSFADFRSNDQAAFTNALANPYTKEIIVLEGTYTFTATVTVPQGKRLKGLNSGVNIVGSVKPFILSNYSSIENINFTITNADGIDVSGTEKASVKNCFFNMVSALYYAILGTNVLDLKISQNTFSGLNGIWLINAFSSRIESNVFSLTGNSLLTDPLTENLHFVDNIVEAGTLLLYGINHLVKGNDFLSSTPSKINSTGCIWRGNYPELANNLDGIDTVTYTLDGLTPLEYSGAFIGSLIGFGTISFTQGVNGEARIPPKRLTSKIDRAKGFSVNIYWTTTILGPFSGNVLWEVRVTFLDSLLQEIGTGAVGTILSSRSKLTVRGEEFCTVAFTSADYGFILGVDPTSVSVVIRRLGMDASDTLKGTANLTEAEIILPRD